MVCYKGLCSQSICKKYDGILEECDCAENIDQKTGDNKHCNLQAVLLDLNITEYIIASDEDKKKSCHVCCQMKDQPESCKSTGELTSYFGRPTESNPNKNESRIIFKQPGSACNNYEGNTLPVYNLYKIIKI